jgi:hypothetical protein
MSFLDNLENNLKSLENQGERDGSAHQRREAERAATLAAAPWAEELKNSAYTKKLMDKAAETGHKLRTKIYMAWLGTTLRLEGRGKKLELRPTSTGVQAVFLDGAEEVKSYPVNLKEDPADLLNEWMAQLLLT